MKKKNVPPTQSPIPDFLMRSLRNSLRTYADSKLTYDTKRKYYKCPSCGKYKLGIYEGGIKFKCHHNPCGGAGGIGIQGDIFDLVGYVEGIQNNDSTLRQRAWHAGRAVGISIPGLTDTPLSEISRPHTSHTSHTAPQTPSPAAPQPQPFSFRDDQPNQPNPTDNSMDTQAANEEEIFDFTAEIEEARRHIEDPDAIAYLAKRGISLETAKRAGVGYAPKWRHPSIPKEKKVPLTKRIILPHDNGGYGARAIEDSVPEDFIKMHAGKKGFFFSDKELQSSGLEQAAAKNIPLIVVEGEFDALSFAEAGQTAVAVGGTEGRKRLIAELRKLKEMPRLILAFDHDPPKTDKDGNTVEGAGQLTQKNFAADLTNLGRERGQSIEFVSEDFMKLCGRERDGGGIPKDANEMLVLDKDALKKGISLSLRILADPNYLHDREHLAIHLLEGLSTQKGRVQLAPTGFTKLDKALDGGLYPGLYTLGAIPSLGKSTLALQIADNIAATGRDTLFFSLEMSKFELIMKILSRMSYEASGEEESASTLADIKRHSLFDEELGGNKGKFLSQAVLKFKNSTQAQHLFIYETQDEYKADTIRDDVKDHLKRKGQTPVVFIDYIQLLAPHNERATDKANMDYAMKTLKHLSRDFDTPVFVISSLNRQNYGEEVSFKAFKESGAVEYGSDVLMGLQLADIEKRDDEKAVQEAKRKNPRAIELVILKNRNGALPGNLKMQYHTAHNCFVESEEKSGSTGTVIYR